MFRMTNVGWLTALLVFATPVLAQDVLITDPEKAGVEYAIQGEYEGKEVESGDVWGAQCIALGKGKFRLMGLKGGLPGQGWKRGDEVVVHEGQLKGGAALFDGEDGQYSITIKNGKLTVEGDGSVVARLKKVVRKSSTLGAKPPANALVLFDGSTAEHFERGKIVMKNLLLADCESTEKFGDHKFHLEFRTPFKPNARGQGRGNSGVYLQSRYEVQVLDSFGLEGKNNECGGIYSISEPKVNMCFPPLTWQTYDVDFTAARYDDSGKKTKNGRVTIRHNGVVIHDDLELTHGTPGKHAEGPEPRGLYLQGHGNPVVYRNVWVVKK